MHPMLNTAVKAARKAGTIINRAALDLDRLTVHTKQPRDYVSEVDRSAEEAIIATLRQAYPGHAILAEEAGRLGPADGRAESEYVWVIDPLDGTTNFLHGLEQYSISIALLHNGIAQQGLVFDPVRNELFTASRGNGAYLNDRRIRVTRRDRLDDALLGTGFPFREFARADLYLALFRDMMQKTAGLRRPGSAALDLAYVACGRYDGFFELNLKPWDFAAGSLLVMEAGGLVGDLRGESDYQNSGDIVAANPKLFVQMLTSFAPHLIADTLKPA
jgi:myo-inositol-1(or 4)-monophosphatase